MTRRNLGSIILATAVCGWTAVAVNPPADASGGGFFKTPSDNIVCQYGGSGARAFLVCSIKSGLRPPPPHVHCDGGDPTDHIIALGTTGRATEASCAGDPGPLLGEQRATVLRYGTSWHGAGLGCSSAVTGLTCRNHSGHGFFLSRAHTRRF